MYILIAGLSVTVLMTYSKNLEYLIQNIINPSGNPNFPFHLDPDTLNSLFFHKFFIFFHVSILRFDKATYLSLLFKSILSQRLSNSL